MSKKTTKTTKSSKGKTPATPKRPATLSLIPLHDLVLFPGSVFPIYLSQSYLIEAFEFAKKQGRLIVLAAQLEYSGEEPCEENIHPTAVTARIMHSVKLPSGEYKIRLHVEERVKLQSFLTWDPFIKVKVKYGKAKAEVELSENDELLLEQVKVKFELLSKHDEVLEDHLAVAHETFEPGALADIVAAAVGLDIEDALKVLDQSNPIKRLEILQDLLDKKLRVIMIREEIARKTQDALENSEREHILREQLRQINVELGDQSDEDDIRSLKEQLEALQMPAAAKKEAKKHLRRLQQLHPDTSEAALARNYIDWIIDLPWSKKSKESLDMREAKHILDEDHFGLKEPKERILDFLGVQKLNKDLRGPILLLVGPPGVGKTSLGQSVARSLGRKFVRISLGGLRDEAELRGHRRTYVGAMPGRIIQGLKNAGSKNPVFMLDELDKVGSDFRGDPASVLLEILDPEQNKGFVDNYLSIPFDLSEVMFIGTANVTDTVPKPLLDRMETIEVPGYTTEEKTQIAKRYLIPRARQENGVESFPVEMSTNAIHQIIGGYTRESGVRELGRGISSVYRKVARMVAENEKVPANISAPLVEKLLGVVKYMEETRLGSDQVGVVTGLAWTEVGGEILLVECAITKGKGQLTITGQIGEVMRESAMAALTYVLSNAEKFGIDPDFYEKSTVHLHVPQGAIPKDGPSAGVAMATALVSVLTGKPVSRDVAMTGEITLRGNVIGIGGLKEKALAARRVGIPTVILPKENERELIELPKYLLSSVNFVVVENMEEVLKTALDTKPQSESKKKILLEAADDAELHRDKKKRKAPVTPNLPAKRPPTIKR